MVQRKGDMLKVVLIDLGFFEHKTAEGYDYMRIKEKMLLPFRGNIIFSSLSLMEFFSTMEKDDLISLAYLLLYLLNG